jgi:uncharacterized protein
VKLNIHEIEAATKQLAYDEPTGGLNRLLVHGDVCDFEMPAAAQVQMEYYRSGQELIFRGRISGDVVGHCARCLEAYQFALATDFSFVLVPKAPLPAEVELSDDDLDLGYYEGDEIDLSPLICEQVILALPTRPLCRDDCKGLCPQCGTNLNLGACRCAATPGDERLAVLRHLKVGH